MASIATFRKASSDPAVTVGHDFESFGRQTYGRHKYSSRDLYTYGVKKMVINSTLHVGVWIILPGFSNVKL